MLRILVVLTLSACLFSCKESLSQQKSGLVKSYKTKRVIVLVVDGPRYSETWGDSSHQYIPYMANEMAPKGIVATKFQNDGFTYTTSGHTAICTGFREQLENTKGSDLPSQPSFLQHYLYTTKLPNNKAFVVTSKDKLFILGNSKHPDWLNKYMPKTDCGNNGPLSGYRNDIVTYQHVMKTLQNDKPDVMVVNFKEPDGAGHANNWNLYLRGIIETDSLVWEIWKYIQLDNYYKDVTTLIVTNDHGRHLDGWKDGFVNHGDECEGCRHINLYAFGPDFKSNVILETSYNQVDITATIAELLGLNMPYCQGKTISELFK